MIAMRKAWWTTVLLAAFTGCTGEEPAGENPLPPPPTPPGGSAPAVKPETSKDEAKPNDEMKKGDEGAKSEAPKDETNKEEPKGELKLEGPTPSPAKSETPKEEEKKGDEKSAAIKLDDEEIANIKKLPAEEQKLALTQLVCPVSGEHLGSMDVPVKVTAEGKTFLLCCKGCNDEVKADPKGVVARLHQK